MSRNRTREPGTRMEVQSNVRQMSDLFPPSAKQYRPITQDKSVNQSRKPVQACPCLNKTTEQQPNQVVIQQPDTMYNVQPQTNTNSSSKKKFSAKNE